MRRGRRNPDPFDLREFQTRNTAWIVAEAFEARGRAAGLPALPCVESWLKIRSTHNRPGAGRAPTRVESLADSSERIHVRRSLHGGWLAPLWHGYRGGLGRLRREIRLTAQLHGLGAPVPNPAFVIAARTALFWRAAFCTVHIEGAIDAIRFLESSPKQTSIRQAATAVGQAISHVHALGVLHADLHLGNLMVRQENNGFRAWVIDLDRARLVRALSDKQRGQQLKRLKRSVVKRASTQKIGPVERQAFLEGYTSNPIHQTDRLPSLLA